MGLARWIYQDVLGWTAKGDFSQDTVKKAVIVAVPHTSWHDFYIGILLRTMLGVKIGFIAKKELFKWPFGYIFRMMGGAAIDRTPGQDKVKAIANVFENKKEFRITIAPEGTRKKVDKLKTGFYYIALAANVPLILVTFDFGKKEQRISKPIYPSGDIDKDLVIIHKFFKGTIGKIPEYSFNPEE